MKVSKIKSWPILLAACAFTYSCNEAGNYNDGNVDDRNAQVNRADDNPSLSSREINFIEDALEKNAMTIHLLEDGMNRATDPQVRSDAQKMMDEQNALRESLRAYANQHRVSLNEVDLNDREEIKADPGTKWDKEWADEAADLHKELVRKFERADRYAEEQELKAMIRTNLPKLRSSLEIAENLESRLD